ncbi:T9SS type A sorting domain-containing protein [Flavobacterium pedocola]
MKQIYALLLTLTISALSFGQTTYLNESFNYPDNTVLTSTGTPDPTTQWAEYSGAGVEKIDVGASNGLSYAGYNDGGGSITGFASGNAAKVDNTGQDINRAFSSVPANGSTIYMSFLVNITNATTGYFIGLTNTGASPLVARIWVKPSTIDAVTKYNIGISNNVASGTYAGTPTELTLGTTYLVILKYENTATGNASLWVKATGVPASEAAAGAPEVSISGSGNGAIEKVYLRQFNASQNQTVDAIYVSSTWMGTTPCSLALGTAVAACDATTAAIDTYNATIPFTGGNSGTYNLSSNVGTIGGDNPSTTATGNITITNIPEGTNVTLTVSGTCNLTKPVTSPECKIDNTLPFNEPFNYTVGTALSTSQQWTNTSTGSDEILATTGNLSYAGITSTGNSVTFSGTGSDTKARFTDTTSGTIYASFLVKVTDFASMGDGNSAYFAGFTSSTGTFNATVWIRRAGTQYQFGVNAGTSAATVVWSANLYTPEASDLFNNQYLTLGYNFTTNLVTLVENPTIGGSGTVTAAITPAAAYTSVASFFLRQDDNKTPTTMVDELKVATTVNFTLGTASFNNIEGLSMYPNPANDILHITTNANGVKTVAIYDVVGKQVLNTTTANESISVASLNPGIYMVKITEEGKTATRKLVIK